MAEGGIDLSLPRVDYHTHNGFYRGESEIWTCAEGWKQASSKKIELLGIADKVEFNHPRTDFIPILRKEIDALANPMVLLGVELDIGHPSGLCVLPPDVASQLDFVIAGAHNQPVKTLTWTDMAPQDIEEYFTSYGEILCNSIRNAPVTIWAHPFLQEVETTGRKYWPHLEPIFRRMCGLCAERGIALEINENYFRKHKPPAEVAGWWSNARNYYQEKHHLLLEMFDIANAEYGLQFSFASDTHKLENVGDITGCLHFAQSLGLESKNIFILKKGEKSKAEFHP